MASNRPAQATPRPAARQAPAPPAPCRDRSTPDNAALSVVALGRPRLRGYALDITGLCPQPFGNLGRPGCRPQQRFRLRIRQRGHPSPTLFHRSKGFRQLAPAEPESPPTPDRPLQNPRSLKVFLDSIPRALQSPQSAEAAHCSSRQTAAWPRTAHWLEGSPGLRRHSRESRLRLRHPQSGPGGRATLLVA